MANRIFEFSCTFCGAVQERYISEDILIVECPECHSEAPRIISPVAFKLDHTFPGEAIKWAKKHESGAKIDTSHNPVREV